MNFRMVALLAVATGITACGTQFTDPILAKEPSEAAACPVNRALQFDGSSYGSMTRLIQDDFTIEAWINTGTTAKGPAFSDGSAIAFADVETVIPGGTPARWSRRWAPSRPAGTPSRSRTPTSCRSAWGRKGSGSS